MNIQNDQRLREKVETRFKVLRETKFDSFHSSVKLFFHFFDEEVRLSELSKHLSSEFPGMKDQVKGYLTSAGIHLSPTSESEAAASGEALLRTISDSTTPPRQIYDEVYFRNIGYAERLPHQHDNDERSLGAVKAQFLEPFCVYVLEQLSDGNDAVAEAEDVDDLLPILARRQFNVDFEKKVSAALDANRPLSLIFGDLDKFKDVNDTYGHDIGDEVLIGVADIIRNTVDHRGKVYRLSGEEIGILLENHTADEANLLAERIRIEIEKEPISSQRLNVTASLGVAELPQHARTASELHKKADTAMYEAKTLGRNLVRISGEKKPLKGEPKKDLRKQPDPMGLSDKVIESIRRNYFSSGRAKCPFDEAILEVTKIQIDEIRTPHLDISCPICGLHELLSGPG